MFFKAIPEMSVVPIVFTRQHRIYSNLFLSQHSSLETCYWICFLKGCGVTALPCTYFRLPSGLMVTSSSSTLKCRASSPLPPSTTTSLWPAYPVGITGIGGRALRGIKVIKCIFCGTHHLIICTYLLWDLPDEQMHLLLDSLCDQKNFL